MGDPEFKIRDLTRRENITVFSSNHAYYGDLSRRVNDVLGTMVPTIETYSIDESFLNLGEFSEREVEPLARELRDRVHRWANIPTCVGSPPQRHWPRSATSSPRNVRRITVSAICAPCGAAAHGARR